MESRDNVSHIVAITLQTLIQVLRESGTLTTQDVGAIETALAGVTASRRLTSRDRKYLNLLLTSLAD